MTPSSTPAWQAHLPEGASLTAEDLVSERSLPSAWATRWREDPLAPAVWHATCGWLRNRDLDQRTRAVAGRFRAAGLGDGDRVLFSAASSPDLVVAHAAALRAGLIVVPVNTGYRRAEVDHIASDAQAAAAVVDDAERGAWVREATGGAAVVTGVDVPLPEGAPGPLDTAGPDTPAMISYTSGTTGRPKGAVLTHGNLLASAEAVRIAWRWTSADRLVLCLPLFHIHGLGVGLHGTLLTGASAVLLERFDVDGVLDAVHEHAATMFFGVPTMYSRFAASER